MVDQLKIVRDQVIGQAAHHITDPFPFPFGLRHQIVIQWVEEIMPIQLIRTGIALPVPVAIGAFRPAWLIDFPEKIPMVPGMPIAPQAAPVRIGQMDRADRPGHVAGGRAVLTPLGNFLQKPERFEDARRAVFRLRIAGGGVGETFARAVHAGPEAVVVAVMIMNAALVPRFFQIDFGNITPRRAPNAPLHLVFVDFGLFGKCHHAPADLSHPSPGGKPGIPLRVDRDIPDVVAGQPAASLPIGPLPPIKTNRSQVGSQPDHALGAWGDHREIVVGQALFPRVESPAFAGFARDSRQGRKP